MAYFTPKGFVKVNGEWERVELPDEAYDQQIEEWDRYNNQESEWDKVEDVPTKPTRDHGIIGIYC